MPDCPPFYSLISRHSSSTLLLTQKPCARHLSENPFASSSPLEQTLSLKTHSPATHFFFPSNTDNYHWYYSPEEVTGKVTTLGDQLFFHILAFMLVRTIRRRSPLPSFDFTTHHYQSSYSDRTPTTSTATTLHILITHLTTSVIYSLPQSPTRRPRPAGYILARLGERFLTNRLFQELGPPNSSERYVYRLCFCNRDKSKG